MANGSLRRLSRTRLGKQFSEGARLLWGAIAPGTISEAAGRLVCTKGMVTHWLYGDSRPGATWAAKVQDIYGVPADTWGRDPTEAFTLPAVESNAQEDASLAATGTDDARSPATITRTNTTPGLGPSSKS